MVEVSPVDLSWQRFFWGCRLSAQWYNLAHRSQVQRQLILWSFMVGVSLKNFLGERGEAEVYFCLLREPQRGKSTAGSQLVLSCFTTSPQRVCSLCASHSGEGCLPYICQSLCPCVSPHPHPSLPGMDQQTFWPSFCWVQPTGTLKGGVQGGESEDL